MTTNRDRQRAAARAKLEREMTQRAEAARRRRMRQAWIGGGVGIVLVIVAVVWVALATAGTKKKPAAGASASASASASPAGCLWNPRPKPNPSAPAQPLPPGVKNVGTPPASGEPRSGTQTMTITTNLGVITVNVDTAKAPCTAASLSYLASKKFYDNTPCHRLTTSGLYVLQCGDPSGTGSGGPTYEMAEENLPSGHRPAYPEGVIAMAKATDPGTTSSQFFIVYKDTEIEPVYTLVGRMTQGLDIVKKIAEGGVTPSDPQNPADGKPKTSVTITSLTMSAPAQP